MNAHTKLVAAMAIGAAVMISALVAGQVTVPQDTQTIIASPPYDMSYGQQYPKSATVAEGYWTGVSRVIRAEGEYNYYTSMAAVNASEALRQNIENRQAIVKQYFELRKLNREYRAAERHPGRSESRVPVVQVERPRQLTVQELDLQTGKVRWPKLLAADTHAENREVLDDYFAERAEKRAMSTREMADFRSVVLAMLGDLKEQRRAAPPAEFEAATEFLRSLAAEGQRAVGEGPRLVAAVGRGR